MARGPMKAFYHSAVWQKQRQYILRRDHYTCTEPGCGRVASEVHHIIELDENNVYDTNVSLNENNLRSLCHECHTRITNKAKRTEYKQTILERIYFDENGYPITEHELIKRNQID